LIGSDTGFWTKNDNQTFTRTNTDAVDSEAIIVSLSGGNAIALSIPTAYTNHLTTLNGSRYTIDVNYNDFLSSQTSDGDQDSNFNFRDLKGTDHSIIKKNILTISIRDLPQIEVTPARYFAYLCYYFVNLIRVDIVFPSTIKT
jgi:hypothetical protein